MEIPQILVSMQLTDSALPTGAFSHSFGFESYQSNEMITDAYEFSDWLKSFIEQQLTFADALAIRLVYAATSMQKIEHIDQLLTAQALPKQVRQAGITMGQRILKISAESYPSEDLKGYSETISRGTAFGHPAIVWALVARDCDIDCDVAVAQHVYATTISLVQNAVRAFPLGPNTGQKVIGKAKPWVEQAVEQSKTLTRDDLGAIAPGLEIAQMNHERQLSRLFMS